MSGSPKAWIKQPGGKGALRSSWPLFTLILAALANSFLIYFYLILPQGPFCWDEAHHSVFSLLVAKSLLSGNWGQFLRITNQQIYWPFLHSWISSVFLILGGFSYQSARFSSLFLHFCSAIIIYFLGKRVDRLYGAGIGLMSGILFCLSPLITFFAATAMLESLGICLTLAVLMLYLEAWRKKRKRYYIFSGFVLGLLYLSKNNYAIVFIVGLALFYTSLFFKGGDRRLRFDILRNIWPFAVGFLAVFMFWIIIPPTWPKLGIILYRFKETEGCNYLNLETLDRILYFPRSFLLAYTFSPWIFIAYLGGLIWSVANWKNLRIRFLLLMFLGNLIPLASSINLQERYIITAFPCLFILTSCFCIHTWTRINHSLRWGLAVLVLVLVLGDIHKLPGYIRIVGNSTLGALNFPAPKERPTSTMFGLFYYPPVFSHTTNILYPGLSPTGEEKVATGTFEDVYQYIWKNTDPRGGICGLFQLNCASPHLWSWHGMVQQRRIATDFNPRCYYFISLTVSPDSPYRTMVNQQLLINRTEPDRQLLNDLVQKGLLRKYKEQEFPDIRVTVTIFTRMVQADHPSWRWVILH